MLERFMKMLGYEKIKKEEETQFKYLGRTLITNYNGCDCSTDVRYVYLGIKNRKKKYVSENEKEVFENEFEIINRGA